MKLSNKLGSLVFSALLSLNALYGAVDLKGTELNETPKTNSSHQVAAVNEIPTLSIKLNDKNGKNIQDYNLSGSSISACNDLYCLGNLPSEVTSLELFYYNRNNVLPDNDLITVLQGIFNNTYITSLSLNNLAFKNTHKHEFNIVNSKLKTIKINSKRDYQNIEELFQHCESFSLLKNTLFKIKSLETLDINYPIFLHDQVNKIKGSKLNVIIRNSFFDVTPVAHRLRLLSSPVVVDEPELLNSWGDLQYADKVESVFVYCCYSLAKELDSLKAYRNTKSLCVKMIGLNSDEAYNKSITEITSCILNNRNLENLEINLHIKGEHHINKFKELLNKVWGDDTSMKNSSLKSFKITTRDGSIII